MALELRALAMTTREIAAATGASPATVKRDLGSFEPAPAPVHEKNGRDLGSNAPVIRFEPAPRTTVPSGYRELMAARSPLTA